MASSASASASASSSALWLPAPTRSAPPPPPPSRQQQRQQQGQLIVHGHGGSGTGTGGLLAASAATPSKRPTATAPPYEERIRAAKQHSKLTAAQRKQRPPLFVPRSLKDFDDGGAFPEIHVAQYPRNMGNPHLSKRNSSGSKSSSSIVNVEIDAKGQVSYDAVATSGTNADKKVYTRHADLRGTDEPVDTALPTTEEATATTNRTAAALQSLVATKLSALKPTGSAMAQASTSQNQEQKTQFVKYTPSTDAPGYNPSASQRVVQIIPAQIDPMQPPKHQHRKAPRGPAEDPVPVLHAPPTKLTKEEADAWKVPACISNWKNTRGYTIPLDKRLAADGRGLREHTINSNFATLSESLYVAERQAREEVKMRALVQKRLVEGEKEKREEELRLLANRARLERTGQVEGEAQEEAQEEEAGEARPPPPPIRRRGGDSEDEQEAQPDEEDAVAARQRERLRIERKKERERELRLEHQRGAIKKQRLDDDRDVSEKIALGQHTGTGAAGGAVDTRLYNQGAGLDSGFGADDEYNAYTKPLFDRDEAAKSIYKPTSEAGAAGGMDADEQYDTLVKGSTTKFQPDKGFAGAEGGGGGGAGGAAATSAGPRNEPVQFEKAPTSSSAGGK